MLAFSLHRMMASPGVPHVQGFTSLRSRARPVGRVLSHHAVGLLGGGCGCAANTAFTLLLVNDIYKMSDDKGRGGFAAAGGASSRPSAPGRAACCSAMPATRFSPVADVRLRPGRAHRRRCTNMIEPDVFVPGNHEFDFGKDVYLKRMGAAKFPVLRRQPARRRRPAAARP